jgi:hypothetical protein
VGRRERAAIQNQYHLVLQCDKVPQEWPVWQLTGYTVLISTSGAELPFSPYISQDCLQEEVPVRRSEGGDMPAMRWEGGTRRTFVAAMIVFTAIMLALPESVLALPSEVPDDTPMVDGRVRTIEQVGTNVWLVGKFTQVKRRDGTVLGSVSNVAVFNSETNRFKNIAPKLGGPDSEMWDMTLYGQNVLIAGKFPGPTSTQKNLVLVKGSGANAGQVIRWYNSPSLKSVLAAPGLERVYGGGVSLSAFDFATGKKLWTRAKTTVDPTIRTHDSSPAYRDLELDADGQTIWAACICDAVDGQPAKALVKLDKEGHHDTTWSTEAGEAAFGQSVVDHNGKLYLAAGAATFWPSSTIQKEAPAVGCATPLARHRQWRSWKIS